MNTAHANYVADVIDAIAAPRILGVLRPLPFHCAACRTKLDLSQPRGRRCPRCSKKAAK